MLGARVAFFGYWLFDNLVIFSKLKLLKKNVKSFSKPAMVCWWLANVCNIVRACVTLKKLRSEKKDLRDFIRKNPEKAEDFKGRFVLIVRKRNATLRLLVKGCGDFLTSSNGWGLTKMVGIHGVNDSHIGLAGLISSSIATYEAYKKC